MRRWISTKRLMTTWSNFHVQTVPLLVICSQDHDRSRGTRRPRLFHMFEPDVSSGHAHWTVRISRLRPCFMQIRRWKDREWTLLTSRTAAPRCVPRPRGCVGGLELNFRPVLLLFKRERKFTHTTTFFLEDVLELFKKKHVLIRIPTVASSMTLRMAIAMRSTRRFVETEDAVLQGVLSGLRVAQSQPNSNEHENDVQATRKWST